MKKFLMIYASVFSFIWIGTGIYAIITNQPSHYGVLLFGLAFSFTIFLTSWFSNWLIKHYKKIDTMTKNLSIKK
ncbi:hypothetical protein [Garciella nitratireducens]|uniref:Uncharacterized protein n=1 Tax=Garciella nitratireducens DSM 15102 TaxID=1121911 RepID=A0A1T4M5M6_9FIRM|nr:hypothetical protein [Garciella nitratireducens]SJZ62211.1 hypothetical protein SAMN02745973_01205 [Garciella nitratireducens DSM 15102]